MNIVDIFPIRAQSDNSITYAFISRGRSRERREIPQTMFLLSRHVSVASAVTVLQSLQRLIGIKMATE